MKWTYKNKNFYLKFIQFSGSYSLNMLSAVDFWYIHTAVLYYGFVKIVAVLPSRKHWDSKALNHFCSSNRKGSTPRFGSRVISSMNKLRKVTISVEQSSHMALVFLDILTQFQESQLRKGSLKRPRGLFRINGATLKSKSSEQQF